MAKALENIFESFFTNSTEGIIIFDTIGKIIYINIAAKELFGISNKSVVPNNMEDLLDKKYQEEFWKICNSLLDKTRKNRVRNKIMIHDHVHSKKPIILGMHLNNHIRSAQGKLIAALIVDDTQRWKEKHELRQSHERFSKIFQHNPVAQLILRESDRIIVGVNNKFLKLFGYTVEEVIGQDILSLGLNHCSECKIKIDQEQLHPDTDHDCEATVRRKNGKLITLQQSYVLIKLHDIAHEIWSLIDITDQKEAKNNLKKINEELEHKVYERTQDLANMLEKVKNVSDLKTRFVSAASHEFRTPLTTILASTGLLESYIESNNLDKCARHIVRIKSSVKVLTDILEDFLSLDKIEQGYVKPAISIFNLNEFAANILDYSEAILKKGQRIEYVIKGKVQIKQDVNLVKKIMINLISNASKYSGEGKIINWSISVQPDKIMITVADSGIGIPADEQPYIFSRFFRAKNAEAIQGTGLGLNIVKKYVELLHGKISFVSTENIGTSFIVELPVLK